MTGEAKFVIGVIVVAAALMASNRVRFDAVALMVVLALMLSGVLTVAEALSGFGSPVVILVAGLLVVGEMLDRTGVAAALGDWILKHGGTRESRLLIVIMAGVGILGAIMSSTAVVAVFIPIVLRIAAETRIAPSRLLLPMSYAALVSGMLTLIATTPNLVVHEELKYMGYDGFAFFSFSLVGLAVLVVAILYIVLLGRRLLPRDVRSVDGTDGQRSVAEVWEDFRGTRTRVVLEVSSDAGVVGLTLTESGLEERYHVRVLGVGRKRRSRDERMLVQGHEAELQSGDILVCLGTEEQLAELVEEERLKRSSMAEKTRRKWLWDLGGLKAMVHPESSLIGKSLREVAYPKRFGLRILGVRRHGRPVEDYEDIKLAASDTLLVVGPWSQLDGVRMAHHELVVLEMPAERKEVIPAHRHLPVALIILSGMVVLTVFNIVPLVAAVLMATLAAVFTGCLKMSDAYRSIHWSSLVLIAGMLPLADALEKTGGTAVLVDLLIAGVGESSPRLVLTVIFFLTATLGLVLSNTASAVLVAPIAIMAAKVLGVSPYAFAVAVVIAASAAFITPVSTPVVALVVEPGGYRFMHFVKVGVPLLLLTYLVTLVLAPLLFPFA